MRNFRVQKWGNSLGVRIPKAVAAKTSLSAGSEVAVTVSRGRVIITPVPVPSLKELLAGVTPDDMPDLADWGAPVGKEVW